MSISEKVTIKPYEQLTYSDDFMFGVTMSDMELCHDVLECLLQFSIGDLEEVEAQKEIRHTSGGKPIRLDIYTRSDSAIYDTEIQNKNKKSINKLELPKRTRFYQALIDTDYLDRGEMYDSLPDSYILFICTFDPFGQNRALYSFVEQCLEVPGLVLEDGTERRFYNCTYDGDDVPEAVKRFYRYVATGEATDELTSRIDEAVMVARKREEWKSEYMRESVIMQQMRVAGLEEGRAEGREIGLEEGRAEGRAEERMNTERERKRADIAEAKLAEAEAKLRAAGLA